MLRVARWLAVPVLLVGLAGPVSGKEKVLLLDAQGDALPAADRDALTTVMRDHLAKYPDIELVKGGKIDLLDEMVNLECIELDADCLSRIGEARGGSDKVVHSEVEKAGASFSVAIKVVDVKMKAVKGPTRAEAASKEGLPSLTLKALETFFGSPPAPKAQMAQVTINSEPPGATVKFDDAFVGKTPLQVKYKPGKYKVTVGKQGFQDEEFTADLTADQPFVKGVSLRTVAAVVAPPPLPPPTAGPGAGAEKEGPFYKKWWFWTAVGVGAAGAGVGSYFLFREGGPFNPSEPAPRGTINLTVNPQLKEKDAAVMGP